MMVCQPHHIFSAMSDDSYASMMDPTEESYTTRKKRRVTCERCNSSMQAKYLPVHNRRVHGLDEGQVCIPAPTRDQGQVYTIDFPRTMRKASCPVPECPGTATSWWSMRRHFVSRHPVDSVHIRQEGPRPLPKCTRCGMQLPSGKLTSQHYSSRLCVEGQARRQQREALNQIALANEQEFTIYGEVLQRTATFKYLGRPMSRVDSDWPAMHRNLRRARQKWARASKILGRQGASPKTCGHLYVAVVQSLLLYGAETWVVSPDMLSILSGFHNRCARRIAGLHPRLDRRTNTWVRGDMEEVYKLTSLRPIEEYLQKRQNTIAEYVATRPIYHLCRESSRKRGSMDSRRIHWWTQPLVRDILASLP